VPQSPFPTLVHYGFLNRLRRCLTEELLAAGYRVSATLRRRTYLPTCEPIPESLITPRVDVTKPEETRAAVVETVEKWGGSTSWPTMRDTARAEWSRCADGRVRLFSRRTFLEPLRRFERTAGDAEPAQWRDLNVSSVVGWSPIGAAVLCGDKACAGGDQ